MPMYIQEIARALLSLVVMIAVLYAMSSNRKAIRWSLIFKGLAIQFVFALLILKVDFVTRGFEAVGKGFVNILGYTREGSLFFKCSLPLFSSLPSPA